MFKKTNPILWFHFDPSPAVYRCIRRCRLFIVYCCLPPTNNMVYRCRLQESPSANHIEPSISWWERGASTIVKYDENSMENYESHIFSNSSIKIKQNWTPWVCFDTAPSTNLLTFQDGSIRAIERSPSQFPINRCSWSFFSEFLVPRVLFNMFAYFLFKNISFGYVAIPTGLH